MRITSYVDLRPGDTIELSTARNDTAPHGYPVLTFGQVGESLTLFPRVDHLIELRDAIDVWLDRWHATAQHCSCRECQAKATPDPGDSCEFCSATGGGCVVCAEPVLSVAAVKE